MPKSAERLIQAGARGELIDAARLKLALEQAERLIHRFSHQLLARAVMARLRKPLALHKLHGTHKPTRHRDRHEVPGGEPLAADPPAWLSANARAVWAEVLEVAPAGILAPGSTHIYSGFIPSRWPVTGWPRWCSAHSTGSARIRC